MPKLVSSDEVSGDGERTQPKDSFTEKEFKPEPKIDPITSPHGKEMPLTPSEDVFGGDKEQAASQARQMAKEQVIPRGERQKGSADSISEKSSASEDSADAHRLDSK